MKNSRLIIKNPVVISQQGLIRTELFVRLWSLFKEYGQQHNESDNSMKHNYEQNCFAKTNRVV